MPILLSRRVRRAGVVGQLDPKQGIRANEISQFRYAIVHLTIIPSEYYPKDEEEPTLRLPDGFRRRQAAAKFPSPY